MTDWWDEDKQVEAKRAGDWWSEDAVAEPARRAKAAPVQRETTLGEFAGGLALDVAQGFIRAPKVIPDALQMLGGDSIVGRIGKAGSDFFGRGIDAAEQLQPQSYRDEAKRPILKRNDAGDITGIQLPTAEAFLGTVVESIPQLPQMLLGGGAASAGLRALGMGRGAGALGFGLSNAANVAPAQFVDTLGEAEKSIGGLAAFEQREATPEELALERADARSKALTAAGLTGLLSTATGAGGAAIAGRLGGQASSLLGALGKGFIADAPFEGVEESGQSVIGDFALDRTINWGDAANAGLLGAAAGGAPGAAIGALGYTGNHIPRPTQAPNAAPRETPEVNIVGGIPATAQDVANDAAVIEAFRARQALGVAPDPADDLNALLMRNLPPEDALVDDGALAPEVIAALNDELGIEPDPDAVWRRPESQPSSAAPVLAQASSQPLLPLGEINGASQQLVELGVLAALGDDGASDELGSKPPASLLSQNLGRQTATPLVPPAAANASSLTQALRENPAYSDRPGDSWVLRNKETGEVVAETYDRKKVEALNTAKYEAVPAGQHLQEVNTEGTKAYAKARGLEVPSLQASTPETQAQQGYAEDVIQSSGTPGKLYQRGNGKNNASAQALQLPDGTWRIRNRKAGTWQPWRQPTDKDGNPIDTFDPSPLFGYRETGMAGGAMTIPGIGKVPVQRSETAQKPDNYNPLLDLIAGSGGISKADARRLGVDPEAMKARRGIRPLFSDKGVELDVLRERMIEDGYLPPEPEGTPPIYDHNDLWAVIEPALNGTPVGPMGDARIQAMAEQRNADAYGPEDTDADADPDDDLARWFDDIEAETDEAINPEDEAEALSLSDLYRELATVGVDLATVLPNETETDGAYAARLHSRLQEARRGTDTQAESGDRQARLRGRADGQAEPVQDFTPGAPAAAAPAAQEVASQAAIEGRYKASGLEIEPGTDARGQAAAKPPAAFYASATGRSILQEGRLLSLVDAATAAGVDVSALREAMAQRNGAAAVAAIDGVLAELRKPAEPLRTTGVKNAVTDAERAAAGRDPILREAVKTNEATLYEAMRTIAQDPLAGQEAIARLSRGGTEGISLADEAVLLVYKTELLNKRDAAAKKLADPTASEDAKATARRVWETTEAEIAALDISAVNAGREWGRFGQFRQRMLREDFTFAALERKERARLERPLSKDESATIRAMAENIAALQEKVDALQTRLSSAASESAYEAMTKRMASPRRARSLDSLRSAANAARARLDAAQSVPSKRGQSGAILSPTVFYDYTVIGAYHFAEGAVKFADWVSAMRVDLGAAFDQIKAEHPNIFRAAQKELEKPLKAEASVAEVLEQIDQANISPKDVRKLIEALVGEGLRGEPAVIEAAAERLSLAADEVRFLFVQTEPRTAQTMTEAREVLRDLRKLVRLQNEIDRLEAGEPKPARGAPAVDSPAVAAKKRELADLRKAMRPAAWDEGRYQAMRGKQIEKHITVLQDRIASGDFATRPRIPRALSEANQLAAFELEKAKQDFLRHQFEDNLKKRTPLGKMFGAVGDTFNLARAILTSFDLSAILRQGGFITYGHPLRALSSVGPSLRAFASAKAEFNVKNEIEGRPNAPLYTKYGLQLTGSGSGPLSQIEEAYASRWLDRFPAWLGGGLVRGSGRSYTAFLNKLRADSFDAMAASLGGRTVLTEAEGKAIAGYINVATGRGKIGTNENAGQVLNTVFFAPRLVASRFQLLAGQPIYGGTPRTRKLIVQDYARFLTGVSIAIALAAFGFGEEEDDSDKPLVRMDPRSADFGKVRIGNTYMDPLAGLAQVTVLLARLATGETIGSGDPKPLRPAYTLTDLRIALGEDIPDHEMAPDGRLPFGSSSADGVLGRFLRTKLAPVPGAIINTLAGSNLIGEEVTPLRAAKELVTPMSFQSVAEVMEAHGIAKGAAITVVGLLGMGVQHRTDDAPLVATDAARTDIKERLATLPVDQWPAEMAKMKAKYGPILDGVDLDYYKADGKYGRAGEPKRNAEGEPKFKNDRLADTETYRANYRAQLVAQGLSAAQVEQSMAENEVHHIIPVSVVREHPLMVAARTKLGYDLDHSGNLIGLPEKPSEATKNGDAIGHWTDHPRYDGEVVAALNAKLRGLRREHGTIERAPKAVVLQAIREVEATMRKKIERKDVPMKGGRLANVGAWPLSERAA